MTIRRLARAGTIAALVLLAAPAALGADDDAAGWLPPDLFCSYK